MVECIVIIIFSITIALMLVFLLRPLKEDKEYQKHKYKRGLELMKLNNIIPNEDIIITGIHVNSDARKSNKLFLRYNKKTGKLELLEDPDNGIII
jgi:hypothetical protein